jgi:tetrapyrrole methylase family protein/MazG family protein
VILVTGLGPGDLDRVPAPMRDILLDENRTVVVRTLDHPAASQLSRLRDVITCDDLYAAATYEEVYAAIVDRILDEARNASVIYAVPGSPLIGEFAVRELLARGVDVEIVPAESFVDAVLTTVGYDPLDRGLQVLNGHAMPDPLVLDKPTIIGHLDRPEVLADVLVAVGRVLYEKAEVTLLVGVGSSEAEIVIGPADEIEATTAGNRTTLFIDAPPGGLVGVVHTMRRLYEECPWDREQTHHSLLKNLVEETYELVEALSRLPEGDPDWVAYAAVEDELGDLLLQVLFHSTIARGVGAFDVDDVAENLRRKLVRRHPHVFGDAEAGTAAEVKRRWDEIKDEERGGASGSAMEGVPSGMPALHRAAKVQNRAAKVGFDWSGPNDVLIKVDEEVDELREAIGGDGDVASEIGDLLFTVVNLTRHVGVDPELALQQAVNRFVDRFGRMEAEGSLDGLDLDQLNQRWERAKSG